MKRSMEMLENNFDNVLLLFVFFSIVIITITGINSAFQNNLAKVQCREKVLQTLSKQQQTININIIKEICNAK